MSKVSALCKTRALCVNDNHLTRLFVEELSNRTGAAAGNEEEKVMLDADVNRIVHSLQKKVGNGYTFPVRY